MMSPTGKLTRMVALARQALRGFSIDSLAMYGVALVSEVPVIMIRTSVVFVLTALTLAVTGHSSGSAVGWIEIGLIPTLWSMLALATPLGTGSWWKQHVGGRKPSERERLAYQDAMSLLRAHARGALALPKRWFVLDTPTLDAAVCGETLMLSRGLLESEHLPAVVAHELGHLATPDGRLTAAINRLVLIPPRPKGMQPVDCEERRHERVEVGFLDPRIALALVVMRSFKWIVRATLRFANGGFGLWLTGPLWGAYWRGREYRADAYAASLGQAEELAEFLETHTLIHDHPVPYMWLTEQTHPPAELRIDRLRERGGGTEPQHQRVGSESP